jgi:uncharacterized integral membrane protein
LSDGKPVSTFSDIALAGKHPMRRFVLLFVIVPLTVVVVFLSVANRAPVTFSLDPFSSTPVLSLTAPFFVFLFAALGLGIVLGGMATWISQRKWRRAARTERASATQLRRDVDQLRTSAATQPSLPMRQRDAA